MAMHLQVLEHLEQLERIEAAAAARRSASRSASGCAAAAAAAGGAQQRRPTMAEQRHVSWVEHSTSTAACLMEGMLSEANSSSGEDDVLSALQALSPHLLTRSQQAAVVLSAWEAAAHTKPEGFDSGAHLTMPGLAGEPGAWRGCAGRREERRTGEGGACLWPAAAPRGSSLKSTGLHPLLLLPLFPQTWRWCRAAGGSVTAGRASTRTRSWRCRWPAAAPPARAARTRPPAAPPPWPLGCLMGTGVRGRPPLRTCATPSPLAC